MSTKDRILAIFACLLWSTAFVGVKYTLGYMSPLTLAGIRFILAGILLLPLCGGMSALRELWSNHRSTLFLAALFNTVILYTVFYLSLKSVRGAQAAIMVGSSPLVAAVVSHFVMPNDRITRRKVVSIMLGISGIVLLTLSSKPWEPIGAKEGLGLILLFCGSLSGAFGNVVVARGKSATLNTVALASQQMLLGGMVLFAIGLLTEGIPSLALPWSFYAVLFWLALVSAGAFSIWFRLLDRVPVSELNLWKFILPIFGAIFSWTLLKSESPDIFSVLGMLLVASGIVWAQLKSRTDG